MGYWGGYWEPRPSVADRKAAAAKEIAKLTKKGRQVSPVVLEGRTIARTFWGKAWCQNLERYSDIVNRLERGRSYVRSGSVVDLHIAAGKVEALVRGTALYKVSLTVVPIEAGRYRAAVAACAGKIDSVIELLQGKLSGAVMEVVTSQEKGLFPTPRQIAMTCSCPDSATMCKHVAAVLYGIGARFDVDPKLLFHLRGADPAELVSTAAATTLTSARAPARERKLGGDLAELFGIELDLGPAVEPAPAKKAARKAGKKGPAVKPATKAAPAKAASAKAPPPKVRAPKKVPTATVITRSEPAQSTSRNPTGRPSPKKAARSASATGTYSRTGRT